MKIRVLVVICFLLVLLFVYTALGKMLDMERFTGELRNQPFPKSWAAWIVWLLPITELLIAALLFFDRTRLIGLTGSFLLMSLFTGYTALVLSGVFHKVPCSCGGVIRQLSWPQHLVFNLFFVLISLIGIKLFMHEHRECRNPV